VKLNVGAALLGTLALALFLSPAPAAAQPPGTVAGTITSGAVPVSGVTVYVFDTTNTAVGFGFTDAAGHYETNPVAPGTYYVGTSNQQHLIDELHNNIPCSFLAAGSVSGCVPSSGTGVTVTNVAPTIVNFDLAPGARISGVVTSAAGSALNAAYVYVYDSDGSLVAIAFTDSLGAWVTGPGLLPGTYHASTFAVSVSGYVAEAWDNIPCGFFCDADTGTPIVLTGAEARSNINFALDAGGSIAGIVTDGTIPLMGVVVQVFTASGAVFGTAVTDDNGVYVAQGLATGNYYVRTFNGLGLLDELYNNVPCPGFCPLTGGTQVFVGVGGNTSGINFSLGAGGSVAGTVTVQGSGTPIGNARVNIYDALGRFVAFGDTDAAGHYQIGLLAGTYFAIASADGYLKEQVVTRGTRIEVFSGGTSNANFTLTPGGRISGVVRDVSGAPLANTAVDVYSADGRTLITTTLTNGSGQYITGDGLPAGSYLLRTRNSAGRIDASRTVAIPGPGTVAGIDFALAGGARISGTVRDASTNAPLAGVLVRLFDATGQQLNLIAETTATGEFVFPAAVLPGTYYAATTNQIGYIDEAFDNIVCVQARCDVKRTTAIVVGAGVPTITNVNFLLARGGSISGQVNGIGSTIPLTALPNETVEIYAENGLFIASAATNATGFYTVPTGLPAGKYFVKTANTAGFVDQVYNGKTCVDCPVNVGDAVTVAVGTTTPNINFTLQRGGRISGTIFDTATGLPLADAPVIIRDATGATVAIVKTDGAGVYRVSLPAGTYYVQTGGIAGYTTSIYNPATAADGVRAFDGRWSPAGEWIPMPSDEGACPRGLCDVGPEFAIDVVEGGDKTAINVSVTSCPAAASMGITPTSLPVGVPGAAYAQTLTATGGSAPYRYLVNDGALPLGLSLNPDTGVISGTPTTAGFSIFTVAAWDLAGCSTVHAYTLTISSNGVGLPGPPLNLAASVENFHGHFTWTPSNTGGEATTYRLEVGTTPGGTLRAFETPDATPAIDLPFIPPGEYWARVRARNEFGLGPALDEYRLLVTGSGFSAPGAPLNVVAVITSGVLTVTWDADSGGTPATGYILEAGTAPGLSNVAAINLGNTRTFTYTAGVPPGVYYLRVRAYNVAGPSDPSRELVLNVGGLPAAPGVPIALTRTVSGSTVTLNWLPPADGGAPTSYVIEAGTGRGLRNIAAFDTGSAVPMVTVNAVPPGAYWVRVRARNAQGLGSATADIRLVVP
jgi:hypothetical protein